MNKDYRDLSFWHDSVPGEFEPRTSLPGDIEVDVAIVGAGFTGLWTAYYLKRINPSLDIAILEAETAGFGASGRNGGWCAGYLSGIEQWLDDPAHRDGGIRLQRLMFDTVRDIGQVTELEKIDCHYERSGALEIAVNPAQLGRLSEELDYLRGMGFSEEDHRWLDADELRESLKVDNALGAIHMRHCAAIHPARLARGLAEKVEAMGVSIFEHSTVAEAGNGELKTPGSRVKADSTVLATEGYSGTIAGRERLLIPLHSMMVATEPLSEEQLGEIHFTRRFCFGNLDKLVTYGQVTADRRIAFGCRGTYHYGSGIRNFSSSDPEFELVRQSLFKFFPALDGIEFSHAWGGAMGLSRTLRPSVNFDPDRKFGWAGGFFGNGVAATHLAGQTLADLVTGQKTERTETPWVNPPGADRKWEPEPLRWLGVKSRSKLMQLADWADYRKSWYAPAIHKTLNTIFP
jgi:glycine/D-amino acid oxidase-like deaminating enzyme